MRRLSSSAARLMLQIVLALRPGEVTFAAVALFQPASPIATIPRRLLWTWLALLALSQAADVATTWHSLAAGLHEQNPVVAATLATGNFGLFAAVKAGLVVALGIAVLGGRPVALNGARLVVVFFAFVALANLVAPLLT